MVSSYGILAELGLENPALHSGPAGTPWTTEPRFEPVEGAFYELAFTRIPARAHIRPVIKRVRTDGPSAQDWFDLDAQRPLDQTLYAYAVKAYRRLDDAGRTVADNWNGNLH